ncbi:5186_t:CDS:2 [Rhizophagus irregularis]|nr:5186_t:CDS:2 [Rhizophagus irregularis]
MELVTTAKRIRKEDELYNFVKKHDYNIFNRFTIGKLHFCFTQGNNTIKLYCMENGLQVVSKKFYEIEKIHLLEFIDCDKKLLIIGSLKNEEKIIDKNQNSEKNEKKCKFKFIVWDLYKTERPIIDDFIYLPIITNADIVKHLAIEPIVSISEMEPWVLDENDESSNKCYNLYQNDKEAETLQLIVGRSTVQIWHQIKNEDNPNKGEPFLEFIWTNHIPVYQEKKATKLQIKKFEMYECESNNKSNIKIKDFYLEVCWYKRNKECSNTIKTEQNINHIIEEEDNEIDKIENKKYKKVIQRKDIIEKFYIVKHACKALEHFNKRYINKDFVDNYIRVRNYEEMITYIKHIVWKFVKYEPQNFKLLDVRYNIMKNLILGDCDNLIKFILFGDDKIYKNKNKEIGHIPSNKLWPGKKFLKDDDLNFDKRKNESKDISNELQNNMELAIYHYKGKYTTIVACLLEYYSNHAMDDAGWMCTVSKAIPLLFEYNYDDYIKKLFLKECFAGHTHNSVEISVNFLTFIKSRISNFLTSHNNEFRSFEIDKFVLLRNPVDIKTNNSTYSGSATNSLTNEILFNIELKQDFDLNSSDNPFTTFSKSILAAYFWINGNWIQRDEFDFWVVDLYTFIASIFLVIVLQNMLIAFMSDEYEAVKEKSRQILLKYKANRIADYEALNHVHLFSNPESQPKYIFYHGLPESYEKWYNIRKDDSKSVIYDNTKEFDFEKFKISDYDQYSIWKYNNYSNIIRMSTENFKNNFSNKIETLIKKFKDEKQIDEIEKFREMLKDEFHKISINGIEKVKKILEDKFEKTKKVLENKKSIGQKHLRSLKENLEKSVLKSDI